MCVLLLDQMDLERVKSMIPGQIWHVNLTDLKSIVDATAGT